MKKNKLITIATGIFLFASCTFGVQTQTQSSDVTSISERMINETPVKVQIGKDELSFAKEGDNYVARQGDFEVVLTIEPLSTLAGKRWTMTVANKGDQPVENVSIMPLYQVFKLNDIVGDQPTIRYFSGSNWYDAKYPPTAFIEHERRFMWNNNCLPVNIGSQGSRVFVPMVQFTVRSGDEKVGCTVLLEWSSKWSITASPTNMTLDTGPTPTDFFIQSDWELTNMTIDAHETLDIPAVHIIYSHGTNWDAFTHDIHSYVLNEVSPSMKNAVSPMPLAYDHWFGIGEKFDADYLKLQVDRAAEIGCEYFVLDCGWAKNPWSGSTVVDSAKFPEGIGVFADYVRSKGMRFGIWNFLEGKPDMTKFHLPHVREQHQTQMQQWRKDWDIQWMRLEGVNLPIGKEALKAQKAMKELYGGFIRDNPEFYMEGCQIGACRMDLNMVRMSHGTWLNDHTGDADVCRYSQLGALRVWPARYLNSAVETFRNTGDSRAFGHNFLSRMAGVMIFSGDIAQWSPTATALAKKHADVYKQIRRYKEQPVFFPLPQPRNPDEWDAVVFGDGKGEAQLLFVFRMDGPDEQFIKIPDAPGKWKLLLDNGDAKMKKENDGYRISLKRNSSALWIRN